MKIYSKHLINTNCIDMFTAFQSNGQQIKPANRVKPRSLNRRISVHAVIIANKIMVNLHQHLVDFRFCLCGKNGLF